MDGMEWTKEGKEWKEWNGREWTIDTGVWPWYSRSSHFLAPAVLKPFLQGSMMTSAHMKLPRSDDLTIPGFRKSMADCWMWYPNMGSDSDYIMPGAQGERIKESYGKVLKVLSDRCALSSPERGPCNPPPNIFIQLVWESCRGFAKRYHPSAKYG